MVLKWIVYYRMADFKTIKGKNHYLYSTIEKHKREHPGCDIKKEWRFGNTGDWVLTDDDCVVQVLKRGDITKPAGEKCEYVRTICGSYLIRAKKEMYGQIAENIYTFSGNYDATYDRAKKRKLNNREFLFARYVAAGDNTLSAYKKAYPKAKDEKYIKKKTNILLNKEEVRTMVKEEIKKILAEEGISPEWIVQKYKDIADLSDRDTDRLSSLKALATMCGLFDTEKKQEQLTVFQGFTPEQMEALSGKTETKLIAHKEKEED